MMWSFQALGPIDMAKVSYPLRDVGYPYAVGARSEALLLVNGNPPILDVDDLTKLDKPALEQDPSYRVLKQRYPNPELRGRWTWRNHVGAGKETARRQAELRHHLLS